MGTPKPIALLKTLITKQNVIVTSGSSYENLDNLSPYFQEFLKIYEGTSMGEQEIHGKIIYANNSPWADVKIEYINNIRVENLCLGVDPSTKNKNEIGLVICGIDYRGIFVVIEDCSKQLFVHQWMEYIGDLCKEYPIKILCIETNQGGDLINFALKSHLPSHVIIKETFSKSSKLTRALGIASLYHNKKVVHLKKFPILEKQMFEFSGSKDRVDALGFAITGLLNKTNNKSHAPWLL